MERRGRREDKGNVESGHEGNGHIGNGHVDLHIKWRPFPCRRICPSLPALTSRNWYQNEVDEELKGVDFGILKYVCDIVVKRFTFAISSLDEFLYNTLTFAKILRIQLYYDFQFRANVPEYYTGILVRGCWQFQGVSSSRAKRAKTIIMGCFWRLNTPLGGGSVGMLTGWVAVAHKIRNKTYAPCLVAWHSGRTSVFGRKTSPVLRSTCWWVATYFGKPSALDQKTNPANSAFYPFWVDRWVVSCNWMYSAAAVCHPF